MGTSWLDLGTNSSTAVDYAGLSVTQDGNSILTASATGSVNNSSALQITNDLNFGNGPIDFSVMDTTDGLTINGSFTPTPEPATTSVCVLMLAAMIVTVRRRQLRKQ